MADESSLKLPDEYTEISYEDGEMSGSGNRRWTSEDTQTAVKWGVSILAAGTVIGLGIKYRTPIRNGIVYAWDQITGCCSPDRGSGDTGQDHLSIIPNNLHDNNYSNDIPNNLNDNNHSNNIPNNLNDNNHSNNIPNNLNDNNHSNVNNILIDNDQRDFVDKYLIHHKDGTTTPMYSQFQMGLLYCIRNESQSYEKDGNDFSLTLQKEYMMSQLNQGVKPEHVRELNPNVYDRFYGWMLLIPVDSE